MLGFCERCHEMTEYTIRDEKKQKNIKGKSIEYTGKEAYCNECESEIFVSDIRDYNLAMLEKAYREKEGLISVSEIEIILEKYDVGKRPLSLLLGWGEGTLTRYLEGDIPAKQYSDMLKKILDDSNYLKEILEKNKDNITDVAYRRICSALQKNGTETDTSIESEDKIDYVVKYLLANSVDITPLALQKLLYFSQGFYKAFTGEYLFYNNCEAWVHGPVYRSIYYKYKDHGYNPIEEKDYEYGDIKLTAVEKELLDSIVRNFGCYSGKVLEKMTHAEEPWRATRTGLSDNEGSDRIIDKELIAKYFNEIKSKHGMLNTSDIRDYSTDFFNKLYN
ncbi:type II TA system antitoxin MqsA family protein [Desulfitobacterium sp.]|uniref:type II TA system antitoxin MqsA family protein n=1 Tax=Desulfitobacterium sp. TaxID=49981 RepID=UPI002D149313|nr:type II TA system antitoxin MqsA family protein [Desulfitobacterium sp.]HVJ49287.1 type II TA system antitoxin MqsA family protein [Desulfitobacterium sp.]